ncbi:MAG: hypothetical protein HY232_12300 [Acidobacteria bacterium]|nr:hypothetical protein [Acidobacteriota bacterium]
MRSLHEIYRLLAEAEGNLATLNARQAELLRQIAGLQQEKVSLLRGQEAPLPPGRISVVIRTGFLFSMTLSADLSWDLSLP